MKSRPWSFVPDHEPVLEKSLRSEAIGRKSEEILDLLTSSLIPLTSDPPFRRRRLPKNEKQILALERRTDYPRRTVNQ